MTGTTMHDQNAESPDADVVLAAVTQKYLIVTCNQAARRLGVTKLQGVTGMSHVAWAMVACNNLEFISAMPICGTSDWSLSCPALDDLLCISN